VIDLKFYFSLFLRRLHYFLIVLTVGTVVGLTLAWMLPPVYVAEARLVVESEQIPDELAASTVQVAATEQLQIIQQRILTRDTLIEMANRLQIYAPTPGQPRPPTGGRRDRRGPARADHHPDHRRRAVAWCGPGHHRSGRFRSSDRRSWLQLSPTRW
jgi:uncharacterized protein involved in exopolysaccharide biosynthesis